MTNKYSDFNKDTSSSENIESNQIKTTDVNILLNRVRLDKKKTFRKRLINSIIIISLISLLTAYLIL